MNSYVKKYLKHCFFMAILLVCATQKTNASRLDDSKLPSEFTTEHTAMQHHTNQLSPLTMGYVRRDMDRLADCEDVIWLITNYYMLPAFSRFSSSQNTYWITCEGLIELMALPYADLRLKLYFGNSDNDFSYMEHMGVITSCGVDGDCKHNRIISFLTNGSTDFSANFMNAVLPITESKKWWPEWKRNKTIKQTRFGRKIVLYQKFTNGGVPRGHNIVVCSSCCSFSRSMQTTYKIFPDVDILNNYLTSYEYYKRKRKAVIMLGISVPVAALLYYHYGQNHHKEQRT